MSLTRIGVIGVIGDVHTEDRALAAVLDFLRPLHLDALLCTGDVVTGTGDANRCCHLLQQAGVATVRGNHDRWFLRGAMGDLPHATDENELDNNAKQFLAMLPVTRRYETPAGPLLLCHGLGDDDMAGVQPNDFGYAPESNMRLALLYGAREYNIVVNGHTHHRMVRTFDHLTIINAGTLRADHQPCFLTADFAVKMVQVYEIGSALDITESDAITFAC
jgi:predicted phosphodiesterase